MDCQHCGRCEETLLCAFFPSELYKIAYFPNSEILSEAGYYFLGRCQYYVNKQCTMHNLNRPVLCIIYPLTYAENDSIIIDKNCPAHETITEEDKGLAKKLMPLDGKELTDFLRESKKHLNNLQ